MDKPNYEVKPDEARYQELLAKAKVRSQAKPEVGASLVTAKAPKSQKIIDAGAEILSDVKQSDIAFSHSLFCQVNLPRSAVTGSTFVRKHKGAWLSIRAGVIDEGSGPVEQPVPYGAMPRIALAWISTRAVQTESPTVEIGASATEFLALLGKSATGGKNGSLTNLRKQMNALAACSLQMGFKGRTVSTQPVKQFDAWQSQSSIWPGQLTLSTDFFEELMLHGVPLDSRALIALKASSLALDAYCWLAYRLHRLPETTYVTWRELREQFAPERNDESADKDFKRLFKKVLPSVLAVYPGAKIDVIRGGIELRKSHAPVAYKTR